MADTDKTKEQFTNKQEEMLQQVAVLEASQAKHDQHKTRMWEAEEYLKSYIESAPDGVYINDLNGTFLYGNKKAEEIIGYAREELLGKSFLKLKLLPPKHLIKAAKLMALNSIGKRTGPDEFELIVKGGGRKWVEITAAPIKQDGKTMVLGFVRDVTERKKDKEIEKQYVDDQAFLSKTATELVFLSLEDDIYTFIAENLRKLVGNCTVIVNSFSEKSGNFTLQSIAGAGRRINALTRVLGKHPIGMTIPIDNRVKPDITSGVLNKVPGGLYELSFGALPKPICHNIEKLLSLGDTHAIAFSWKGYLYGSAAILMHRGNIIRNPHAVRTFVNQVSIALQRRQAEQELKQAHDELEMRVKERTRELEKANEAIKESERKYRLITDNTADFIAMTTFEGVYVYLSPSHKRLGYTESDLLGKNALQIMHDDDRKRLLPLLAKYAGMKIKGLFGLKNESFSQTVSYRFPDKWGNWHYFESTGSIVDAIDGKGLNILFITRDITERKQVEEKLESAAQEWRITFDSITTPVSIHDKNFRLIRANRAFAETFHINLKELNGRPCYKLIHGTDEPMVGCPLAKTLATGLPATAEFFEPQLGIYLNVSSSPVFGEDSQVLSCVHIASDITKRKQTEDTLRFLTAKSERMSAMSTLAAGVAHELNNPMMGILNLIQYCLKHTSEDDLRYPVLQDSEREAKRCADIVKNLMSFSLSGQEGEVEYEKQRVAIIIDRVIKLLSYRTEREHVTVTCHVAEELPEIWIKTNAIQQVVLNIVDNALDALAGCPKKEIYIEAQPEGEFAKILFCDSGCGIAPETQERIFEPFFTTKPVGQGTGLGLSVSRNIVNEHGGSITCESTPGTGAKFKMLLPIHTRRKEEKQDEQASPGD